MNQPKELRALTGLRGIAALWVFLFHAELLTADITDGSFDFLKMVASAGYLGVDLFFVLSGFVIAYNYADLELHRSVSRFSDFLWKRLARIYPAHLAGLAIFAASLIFYRTDSDLSLPALIQSLTLTQAWDLSGSSKWNPVAWSISCEFAAYLIFPLFAVVTRAWSARFSLLVIIILFMTLFLAYREADANWPSALGIQRVLVEFPAGVLVYRIWKDKRVGLSVATLLSLSGLLVVSSVCDHLLGYKASGAHVPVLACVAVYGLATSQGALERTMARFEYAGRISYSFYLVHLTVLSFVEALLVRLHATQSHLAVALSLLLSLAAATLLADLLYRYVESPARRAMMSRIPSHSLQSIRQSFRRAVKLFSYR